jgi:Flp pilus assembly CpaF family ATPase
LLPLIKIFKLKRVLRMCKLKVAHLKRNINNQVRVNLNEDKVNLNQSLAITLNRNVSQENPWVKYQLKASRKPKKVNNIIAQKTSKKYSNWG